MWRIYGGIVQQKSVIEWRNFLRISSYSIIIPPWTRFFECVAEWWWIYGGMVADMAELFSRISPESPHNSIMTLSIPPYIHLISSRGGIMAELVGRISPKSPHNSAMTLRIFPTVSESSRRWNPCIISSWTVFDEYLAVIWRNYMHNSGA